MGAIRVTQLRSCIVEVSPWHVGDLLRSATGFLRGHTPPSVQGTMLSTSSSGGPKCTQPRTLSRHPPQLDQVGLVHFRLALVPSVRKHGRLGAGGSTSPSNRVCRWRQSWREWGKAQLNKGRACDNQAGTGYEHSAKPFTPLQTQHPCDAYQSTVSALPTPGPSDPVQPQGHATSHWQTIQKQCWYTCHAQQVHQGAHEHGAQTKLAGRLCCTSSNGSIQSQLNLRQDITPAFLW